jgi:hypothetical protein
MKLPQNFLLCLALALFSAAAGAQVSAPRADYYFAGCSSRFARSWARMSAV